MPGIIGGTVSIADCPHRVQLQNPGAPVPDGDGGYTTPWVDCVPPQMWAQILPATQRNAEKVASGTVITTATHIITMPFHPQVTTHSRLIYDGRTFNITSAASPGERNVQSVLVCVEAKP
jgi:SPP1 family predicted phage head-tail adaptor